MTRLITKSGDELVFNLESFDCGDEDLVLYLIDETQIRCSNLSKIITDKIRSLGRGGVSNAVIDLKTGKIRIEKINRDIKAVTPIKKQSVLPKSMEIENRELKDEITKIKTELSLIFEALRTKNSSPDILNTIQTIKNNDDVVDENDFKLKVETKPENDDIGAI